MNNEVMRQSRACFSEARQKVENSDIGAGKACDFVKRAWGAQRPHLSNSLSEFDVKPSWHRDGSECEIPDLCRT
jgi:hypothetical protein